MQEETTMTFDVNSYVKDLDVPRDNEVLQEWEQLFDTTQVILNDAYSERAYFWGVASAM